MAVGCVPTVTVVRHARGSSFDDGYGAVTGVGDVHVAVRGDRERFRVAANRNALQDCAAEIRETVLLPGFAV